MSRAALWMLLPMLTLAGCSDHRADRPPAAAEQDSAERAGEAAMHRPDSIQDTLSLEGNAEVFSFRLFRAPDDFPLRFSAYLPKDMVAEEMDAEGGGKALRFVANFGGVRNPDALIHIYVYPAGTPIETARGTARAFIESRGVPVSRGEDAPADTTAGPRRFDWSSTEDPIRLQVGGQWLVGTIAIGRHSGRIFHIVVQYPEEYGDGFGPRAAAILRSWRWADTGTPLMVEADSGSA